MGKGKGKGKGKCEGKCEAAGAANKSSAPPPSYPTCEADDEILNLIRANYNLIYVVTWEDRRVIDSLERICEHPKVNYGGVLVWDAARGLVTSRGFATEGGENLVDPSAMLQHVANKAEELRGKQLQGKASRGPIFVLSDFFRFLGPEGLTPEVERRLRNLNFQLKRTTMHVVITSPELQLPTALEKCMAVIDYPLPGPGHLGVLVDGARRALLRRKRVSEGDMNSTPREEVVRALQGLTMTEAEDALAKSIVVTDKFDVPTVLDLKRQIIRKGQLLDYVRTDKGMADVGGLMGVKEFVRMRRGAFGEKAREYGLPAPKGIFLLGVQGSGKSLCAKAVANELRVPLLKLDMGRMFSELMGQSESRTRRAIKLAESVAPCVLLVDEIDKAFSGVTGASTDSGTTKRVVGHLLDWMQEKLAPVFIVACANSLAGLPAELLRKGRFDEAFFVDLPTPDERTSIFRIHLGRRGRDPGRYDVERLAAATDRFSGAEIEGAVVEAMFAAFADGGREFTTEDVENSVRSSVPLADVMREEIDELRESARGRMRRAGDQLYSNPPEESAGDGLEDRFGGLQTDEARGGEASS